MKVISILNQKGGSGKTTLATHLARALQIGGGDVILIDADPQGSARDWSAARDDQPLTVIGIDRPTIDRDIKKFTHLDYVVIDGAPRSGDLAASAVKAADLVLIPVQPSPYDIWATADLVDVVRQRIELTDGALQAAFVITRTIKGTRIGDEVSAALEGYGLPILTAQIAQRVVYPTTAATGQTVFDRSDAREAKAEIRRLTDEILNIIAD